MSKADAYWEAGLANLKAAVALMREARRLQPGMASLLDAMFRASDQLACPDGDASEDVSRIASLAGDALELAKHAEWSQAASKVDEATQVFIHVFAVTVAYTAGSGLVSHFSQGLDGEPGQVSNKMPPPPKPEND